MYEQRNNETTYPHYSSMKSYLLIYGRPAATRLPITTICYFRAFAVHHCVAQKLMFVYTGMGVETIE